MSQVTGPLRLLMFGCRKTPNRTLAASRKQIVADQFPSNITSMHALGPAPGQAIATRYDKTARNFLAAIHLTSAVVWLN